MGRVIIRAGYRSWARRIFAEIDKSPGNRAGNGEALEYVDITRDETITRTWDQADLALFYGWSRMVPDWLTSVTPCYCLHPSPLPRYRGGSPLQHQIMEGQYWSAVSIFRMTNEMDAGPIFAQVPITLDGSLADIFDRIVKAALEPTRILIDAIAHPEQRIATRPQLEREATDYVRRTPADSEITPDEIAGMTARALYNKVRALAHPEYPAPFIKAADGKPLYIWRAELEPPK
jgi:methionyl-tRNA formyltransferase